MAHFRVKIWTKIECDQNRSRIRYQLCRISLFRHQKRFSGTKIFGLFWAQKWASHSARAPAAAKSITTMNSEGQYPLPDLRSDHLGTKVFCLKNWFFSYPEIRKIVREMSNLKYLFPNFIPNQWVRKNSIIQIFNFFDDFWKLSEKLKP